MNLIGWRNTQWDEVEQSGGEIVGVLFNCFRSDSSNDFKEKAIEIEQKFYGNIIYEQTKSVKKRRKN